MNFSVKNKNSTQTVNNQAKQAKQQGQGKQTKKKACIIKLQVNKLLKPQMGKHNSHKSTKSQQFHSHTSSHVLDGHHKSLEKQTGTKPEKKVIKSFEQLYFEKIKERKLQQAGLIGSSDFEQQRFLVQRNKPNSCKNIVTIKAKNQNFFPSPQSTKNKQLEQNKENTLNNIKDKSINQLKPDKFFKKKDIKKNENDIVFQRSLSRSIQKIAESSENLKQNLPLQEQTTGQQRKYKKILTIKRSSKAQTKQTIPTSAVDLNYQRQSLPKLKPKDLQIKTQKQPFQFKQNGHIKQKTQILPINFYQNPSAQLKTIKLSTPSSSASKSYPISFTQSRFDQISHSQINHSAHQHIWDGIQCFFSFAQFQFILQQLGFKDTLHIKQISFYLQKLWQHLGGDIYGGVVRKNLRQFLNLVLQDDNDINTEIAEALTSKSQLSLEQNFIDKASLKLINLDQTKKDQIRKFYFPFRITKLASQIHHLHIKENSGQKLHNSINSDQSLSSKSNHKLSSEKKSSNRSNVCQSKEICLQNNAYLDTISVKNRNQELSPYMVPRTYESSNDMNLVTDFSPKMPAQKYESFKSTVLSKDELNEKLSTEQQEEFVTVKSRQSKPLLSVDVNLGEGVLQKLLVYEGENPYEISVRLKERYNIDEELREKFEKMLRNHLNTLLFKIEEVSEQLFEDSVELKPEENLRDFVLMDKE